MQMKIEVVLEKSARNYSAYAPEVPGCISTGKTADETLENMRKALKGHLEWMARDGDPMPESEPEEAHVVEVEVAVPAASAQGTSSKVS
ncbi:MAG TPA: type II toxin-antitoxin system HicB family antitoxin [Chloroflexia bacterium]|nr:type II toxin-antitoxin system HicB family antitoxin [Chloroflexia bacterium]